MTRGIFLGLIASVLAWGCHSGAREARNDEERLPNHVLRKKRWQEGNHGFVHIKGVGWKYFKPGRDRAVMKYSALELVEYFRKSMTEEKYADAMFGARLYLQKFANKDSAPEAQRTVGDVYMNRGFDREAFEEYQTLLNNYPKYEKAAEVEEIMIQIADSYLDGKWFRWKLPYQESVYIPTGPSMYKTSKLYNSIVTNAPYGTFAAQAQYGIGQAHERALKGFWGWLASEGEYQKATRAYQLLTDRYSYREGDANRTGQEEINGLVASARYRMAELYEVQANEGIYDQSMAQRAIDAFQDFQDLHENDPNQGERLKAAGERQMALYMERASGLKAIAAFYEEQKKWVAARKYYGQINDVLGEGPLASDRYREEAEALSAMVGRKLVRLDVARVQQALAQYDFAQAAEKEGRLYTSLRAFRVANLNLNGLTEEGLNGLVKEEPLTPEHVARALTIKKAVPADLVRVDGEISLPDEKNQPRRVNE